MTVGHQKFGACLRCQPLKVAEIAVVDGHRYAIQNFRRRNSRNCANDFGTHFGVRGRERVEEVRFRSDCDASTAKMEMRIEHYVDQFGPPAAQTFWHSRVRELSKSHNKLVRGFEAG